METQLRRDREPARDVGSPISVSVGMGPRSDDEVRLIGDTGGKVSVELAIGRGTPPTARALAHGPRPSLGVDVVTTVPGDPVPAN
jgi:hypothetical protein